MSCRRGQVLFTPPHEVRVLPSIFGAEGQLLCLAPDGVPEGVDPFLLQRLSFFRVNRPAAVLDLSAGDHRWLEDRIESMESELGSVDRIANYGLKDGRVFDFISRSTPSAGGSEEGFFGQVFKNLGKRGALGG